MQSVWGFFYGGLINPAVMEQLGMKPQASEVATLPGFDIRIAPWVNLVASPGDVVYGLLLKLTHAEIAHVYGQLKATYLPYPVLALDLEGRMRPAICYIVPEMASGQAERTHVENLLKPAEALGFPDWYHERIRSFLPTT